MKQFTKLTIASHAKTRDFWREKLSEEVYTSTLKNTLDAIGLNIFNKENSPASPHFDSYYGLFKNGNEYASAILAFTETKHVNITKVLNIYIFHDEEETISEESVEVIAEIHADLLQEYFKIADRTQGEVKVYARTNLELGVFKAVHTSLEQNGILVGATAIKGRWLIINLN